MSAHVLLNLLNELGNKFNKFINTGAQMLDYLPYKINYVFQHYKSTLFGHGKLAK